jgi:hypothetical protein
MPERQHVAEMFRGDVEAAGLAYRDDSERVADFQSLRHTFISNLARGGVHPKVAQTLARHSTITLTMDRYSQTLVGEQVAALDALPDLSEASRVKVRLTGTEGPEVTARVLASCLAQPERFLETQLGAGGRSTDGSAEGVSEHNTLDNSGKAAIFQGKESGEDRTAIELFIAGVLGWEADLRRFLDTSADGT